jgi:hypothetical protein
MDEIDAFVSEELYIHSKVCTSDPASSPLLTGISSLLRTTKS